MKPILFAEEIKRLKQGEGLSISKDEWPLKTSPMAYYYGKYNRHQKIISVHKVADGFLIVKL